MKVGFIIHIGNYDVSIKIMTKLYSIENNLLKKCDCYINFVSEFISTSQKKEIIKEYIKIFRKVIIFNLPNKGCDLGSFIGITKYLIENNINHDFIFKIHTKTNDEWRDQLIDTLINNFIKIIKDFKNDPRLGIVCSDHWLLKLDNLNNVVIDKIIKKKKINLFLENLFVENKKNILGDYDFILNNNSNLFNRLVIKYGYNNTINQKNNGLILKELKFMNMKNIQLKNKSQLSRKADQIYFVGGTIFIFRFSMLKEFLKTYNFNLSEEFNNLENGYLTNEEETYTHAWERILTGIIPYCTGYTYKTY